MRRLAAREAVRSALFEARLSALQAQLQPHFLFNALNSLLPLVGSEPGRARRMILRLGDLLRASLVAETTQLVTLERDLTLLDEYLDIERMRFRDRIQTDIEADATARSAQVPSFLLQPLVENAIKHGADPRTGRVRIQIEASAGEGSLSLTIRDDGPGLREAGAGERGIGLTNIRRRLEMLSRDAISSGWRTGRAEAAKSPSAFPSPSITKRRKILPFRKRFPASESSASPSPRAAQGPAPLRAHRRATRPDAGSSRGDRAWPTWAGTATRPGGARV